MTWRRKTNRQVRWYFAFDIWNCPSFLVLNFNFGNKYLWFKRGNKEVPVTGAACLALPPHSLRRYLEGCHSVWAQGARSDNKHLGTWQRDEQWLTLSSSHPRQSQAAISIWARTKHILLTKVYGASGIAIWRVCVKKKLTQLYIQQHRARVGNHLSLAWYVWKGNLVGVASEWGRFPKLRALLGSAPSSWYLPPQFLWHGQCLSTGWPLISWDSVMVLQLSTPLLESPCLFGHLFVYECFKITLG